MKIRIEQYCDGFAIIVNGVRHSFDQEETVEDLVDVFEEVVPDADIEFEDCY